MVLMLQPCDVHIDRRMDGRTGIQVTLLGIRWSPFVYETMNAINVFRKS